MKKLIILLSLFAFVSCKRMAADYESRKVGVLKVCPNCTFVLSEGQYFAADTSKQPNIIYKIYFKSGGVFYTASDVDHLVRVN